MARQNISNINNVVNITNVEASVVNVHSGPNFDPKKRRTLAVMWGFAKGVVVGMVGNRLMPVEQRVEQTLFGPKDLMPQDDPEASIRTDYAHAALAYALFLRSDASRTQYLPPVDWKMQLPDVPLGDNQYTYGHEAEVLRSMARFLHNETLTAWVPTTFQQRPNPRSSHVMLGSGSSNGLARSIIGSPWKPRSEVDGIKLHYTITQGDGTILKRYQYGREHAPPAHVIWRRDQEPVLQPQVQSGWQQDDFLLVTRIPGASKDTVRTVLSGLHGPGTRGAELLFTSVSKSALETLASAIALEPGEVPYFQAVFRTSEFSVLNGSHVPRKIELVTDTCPPVRIHRRA